MAKKGKAMGGKGAPKVKMRGDMHKTSGNKKYGKGGF